MPNQALTQFAAALAEPSRMAMLCALMDGRAYTATELSLIADISPSTASSHLSKLCAQKLLDCVRQGRHRYYRLYDEDTAALLESMLNLSAARHPALKSRTPPELCFARSCYQHLAGTFGVRIAEQMQQQGWLTTRELRLSTAGWQALQQRGICVPRKLIGTASACMDWSERRPHIGAPLGNYLLRHCLDHGWLSRESDSRALHLTETGKRALPSNGLLTAAERHS